MDDAIRPAYPAKPDELDPAGAGIYDLHRELVAPRRRHSWVRDATPLEPDVLSNEVLAFRRTTSDDVKAVIPNAGDSAAEAELPLPDGEVLAGSARVHPGGGNDARLG